MTDNSHFLEGLPENFGNAQGKSSLLVLYDLLNQVCDLFTKGRIVSVILVTQNLFNQGPKRYFIKRKVRGSVEERPRRNKFSFLARQVYPENSDSLYRAYLDSVSRPHGYLILDFAQDTDDRVRFRTVFLVEFPPFISAPSRMRRIKSNYDLHEFKNARPKLRKATLSSCEKEVVNTISECTQFSER